MSTVAGRARSVYEFITAAQRQLVRSPQDIALRGKLAEAYLAVDCPDLAEEELRTVRAIHPSLPGLDEALQNLAGQQAARVPGEQLQRQLVENLAICRQRWPERQELLERVRLPEGLAVFRCGDGNIQARLDRPGQPPSWFAFVDHQAAARQSRLPPQATQSLHNGFLVCCLGLGEPVHWLFDATRRGLNGLEQTIILLEPHLENLAVNLAIRSWDEILTARRVRLFVGPDWRGQVTGAIRDDDFLPIPSFVVNLPGWPQPRPVDGQEVLKELMAARAERIRARLEPVKAIYGGRDVAYWARRFSDAGKNGQPPLRILGVTSLMTTVLQYSMRDWLRAFDQLGCQTRLLTEPGPHCTLSPGAYLETILEFQPDLLVLHDHLRYEYQDWFPANLPMLTWIQDRMPQLFAPGVGRRIGPLDFVTGIGKKECVALYDYPSGRFLPMPPLTSSCTYRPLGRGERVPERYRCDVSYVSHAGMTAEQLIDQAAQCSDEPLARRLITSVGEDLLQRYRDGQLIFTRRQMEQILIEQERRLGARLDTAQGRDAVLEFLLLKFNSPLLRQTVAGWLLDAGLNLHLYGQGWEQNPRFARYARGVAANGDELRCIFQGSRINLQIQPFGAIHSRLLDGLASGGFFLILTCPFDQVGRTLQNLYRYVEGHNISDYRALLHSPEPQVQQWLRHISECTGWDVQDPRLNILVTLRCAAELDFCVFADVAIPCYDEVSFSGKQQLLEKVSYFLGHERHRVELAGRMSRAVGRFSYRDGTARMLRFVAGGLQESASQGRTGGLGWQGSQAEAAKR